MELTSGCYQANMILMSSTLSPQIPRRPLGAVVAALLWLPVALLVIATGDPRGVALGAGGLLVSALVGSLLTDQAIASRGLGAWVALRFAGVSVLSGAFVFGLLFAVLAGHSPFDAVGFALFGLVFLGIPLVILGFNLALIWVAVVRRLLRPARE